MSAQNVRTRPLVLAALVALPLVPNRTRADEAADIKAVEAAGGKVQTIRLQSRTLYVVRMDGCPKAGEALAKLGTIGPGIEHLHLSRSGVTDDALKPVAGFTSLGTLDLSETAVTDAALAHLKKLPRLIQLELKKTKVSAEGLGQLNEFSRLMSVSVSPPALTDAGLKNLAANKELSNLTLVDGAGMTDTGFAVLGGFKELYAVRFDNCPVTAKALNALAARKRMCALAVTGVPLKPDVVAALKALKRRPTWTCQIPGTPRPTPPTGSTSAA
ncbi:MAG: hypothetical protein FJ304_06990 [Planctomycetes bacterium]|nr:hypothetical protein [Planctomycetota bacterium]